VKALEGLLLTYRNNDDKYIYLPIVLANRSEESINQLKRDFGDFASNEIHGDYDRGYFKALADYVTLLSGLKTAPPPIPLSEPEPSEKDEAAKKDSGLTPYLAESS